jgi:hypothetical protein
VRSARLILAPAHPSRTFSADRLKFVSRSVTAMFPEEAHPLYAICNNAGGACCEPKRAQRPLDRSRLSCPHGCVNSRVWEEHQGDVQRQLLRHEARE